MKVIDLLNKIANNEEVPKKIEWDNCIFAYSEYDKDYLEFPFSEDEYKGLFNERDAILSHYLNDEVEIIEEDKEIEKIELGVISPNGEYIISINDEKIQDKINELVKAVNELKKGK